MNKLEALKAARELITPFENWTQQKYNDRRDDGALCFCAMGAVERVVYGPEDPCGPEPLASAWGIREAVRSALDAACQSGSIFALNDQRGRRRTHRRVLKAFDRAIAKLEAQS